VSQELQHHNPENDGLHIHTIEAINQAVEEYRQDVASLAGIKCRGSGSSVISDGDVWNAVNEIRVKKERSWWRSIFGYALEVVGAAVSVFGVQLTLGVNIAASDEAAKVAKVAAATIASLTLNGSNTIIGIGVICILVGIAMLAAGVIIREQV